MLPYSALTSCIVSVFLSAVISIYLRHSPLTDPPAITERYLLADARASIATSNRVLLRHQRVKIRRTEALVDMFTIYSIGVVPNPPILVSSNIPALCWRFIADTDEYEHQPLYRPEFVCLPAYTVDELTWV